MKQISLMDSFIRKQRQTSEHIHDKDIKQKESNTAEKN